MAKHCNNLQCFKEKKLQSEILNQLNIKKKIDRDNFRKKITKKKHQKKEKKSYWKHYSNSQCFMMEAKCFPT